VIRCPKFGFTPESLAEAKAYIRKCTKRVGPKIRLSVVEDDSDDDRIVESAVESNSEAIITHDKDLLRMKSYEGIKMLTVSEFLRGPGIGRSYSRMDNSITGVPRQNLTCA
jgi:predicted nucleic acid-binding protein